MQMSIRWIMMRLRDEVAKHKNTVRCWPRPPRDECEGTFLTVSQYSLLAMKAKTAEWLEKVAKQGLSD
jgi:hypothetical protein